MRLVAGLLMPDEGTVTALGFEIPKRIAGARPRIGYMPQQYSLYGDLSVAENLRFFAGLYGVARSAFRERSERLLGMARLAEFRARPAAALSGGMYKKLALSCALIHAPSLLLLDEPTNGVDPVSRRELWAFLREQVVGGVAVLYSTPYMDEAARCDRVGLVVDGRIRATGRPADLIAAHPDPAASFEDVFLALTAAEGGAS
jgi:ABC-2 type transport system ATP-binding protein